MAMNFEDVFRKIGLGLAIVIITFFFLAFCSENLIGQIPSEAEITLEGYAYGAIDTIQHNCPIRDNGRIEGYVGMEVTCEIWAIDSTGAFTPSSLVATPADSSRIEVSIITESDSLGNYQRSNMYIRVLRRGNWHVDVEARPILMLMGYMYNRPVDDQGVFWPRIEYPNPEINLLENEQFIFCAYVGGYANATHKSLERPIPCPDLGGTPLPEIEINWTLPRMLEGMAQNNSVVFYDDVATPIPMLTDMPLKSVDVVSSQ